MATTQFLSYATDKTFLTDKHNLSTNIYSPSPWSVSIVKRSVDIAASVFILSVMFVPMMIIALLVKFTSPGGAFFSQERIGRHGKTFRIFKFRTMRLNAEALGASLTRDGDSRVTGIGNFLRKFKLDELPQLFNVVNGDMSLVGPRPKVPRYAEMRNMPYRPGITGAASLEFRNEEALLRSFADPKEMDCFYMRQIMPAKALLDGEYMSRCDFWSDVQMILATFFSCFRPPAAEISLNFTADVEKYAA
jgi:lipopolysaccharide/colanic/teichoic acid biosynthesis glycosyltransferase